MKSHRSHLGWQGSEGAQGPELDFRVGRFAHIWKERSLDRWKEGDVESIFRALLPPTFDPLLPFHLDIDGFGSSVLLFLSRIEPP